MNDGSNNNDHNQEQINVNNIPTFPTKSGLTEKDAIDICTRSIRQSSFGEVCLKMYPDIDFSVVIEECVTDIKVLCHTFENVSKRFRPYSGGNHSF